MADVTISQLTRGVPVGNNVLPYSTGSNTLGVPVSGLFENTSNVAIGSVALKNKGSLQIKNGLANSGDLIVGNMTRLGGNLNQGFIDFNAYYDPETQQSKAINSKFSGEISFNANEGIMEFRTTSNQQTTDATLTNFNSKLLIDNNGVITKPFQPAFAVKADLHTVTQNSTTSIYPKINFPYVIFNQGNYWDTTNKQFVAPVAGIYSFSGMLRLDNRPTYWFYPMLLINGEAYSNLTRYDSQGALPGLNSISNSVWSSVATNWHQLVKLNAGDVITLGFRTSDDTTYTVDNQTVWYGYLLG